MLKHDSTHPPRVVLDTNVWLDWLVFNDASVVALKAAQAAQRIEIVRDQPGELELERVLEYKAIKPLAGASNHASTTQAASNCRRTKGRMPPCLK